MKLFSNIFTKFAAYKLQKEIEKLGFSENDFKIDPKKISVEKLQKFKSIFDRFIEDNPHLKHLKKEFQKENPELLTKHKQEIERWIQKHRKEITDLLKDLQ